MFIYPFASTTIIGIIKPCKDRSGREFPFLLFIKLETNLIQKIPYYLIPFRYYGVLNSITESLKDVGLNHFERQPSSSLDLASINEMLNKISYLLSSLNREEDYDKYQVNTLSREFWERTADGFNSPNKLIFAKNLFSLKSNTFISTIYLHFSSSENFFKEDLSFFIQLIMKTLNHPSLFPAMFWSIKDNLIRLFLFRQKLLPINFVDLIYESKNEERVMDLFNAKNIDSYPLSLKALFDKQNISLKEFLKAI
jgi:hypothetical protein